MPDTPVLLDEIPRARTSPHPCWGIARANPGKWVETDLSVTSVSKLRARYTPDGYEVAPRRRTVYVRYTKPGKATKASAR